MEGAPLVAAEAPDERRNEALDTDDTKDRKDKDKKKKKNAPTIHLSRLDVERPAELAEKRKNDKKDLLGGVSLSGLGLGPKNETSGKHDTKDGKEKPLPSKQESEDGSYSPVEEAEAILAAHSQEQEPVADEFSGAENGEQADSLEEEPEAAGSDLEDRESAPIEDEAAPESDTEDDDYATSPATSRPVSSYSAASAASSGGSGSTGSAPLPPLSSSSSGTSASSGPAASAGAVPPLPPVPPIPPAAAAGFNAMPLPSPAVPNLMPTAPIEQEPTEKSPNYFLLGVGVGAVIEHIRHKKREKKLHKELDKQTNATAEVAKKQQQSQEEMRKMRAKQLEETAERRWREMHPLAEQAAQESAKPAAEQKSASKVGDIVTENTRAAAEVVATIPLQAAGEKAEPFTVYERESAPNTEVAKAAPEKPETAPQAVEPQDEPVHVEKGRRVETSSWHRMEIDKATGKVVENPSIAYGEAFEAERHQEVKAQADSDAATKDGLVAASVGLLGGHAARQAVAQGVDGEGTLVSSGSRAQSGVSSSAQKPAKHSTASSSATVGVGLWLTLAVLVVLIFLVLT